MGGDDKPFLLAFDGGRHEHHARNVIGISLSATLSARVSGVAVDARVFHIIFSIEMDFQLVIWTHDLNTDLEVALAPLVVHINFVDKPHLNTMDE